MLLRRILIVLLVALSAALLLAAPRAWADSVTITYSPVTFDHHCQYTPSWWTCTYDGGTLSGSFTFDDIIGTTFSFSVAGGAFSDFTYTEANSVVTRFDDRGLTLLTLDETRMLFLAPEASFNHLLWFSTPIECAPPPNLPAWGKTYCSAPSEYRYAFNTTPPTVTGNTALFPAHLPEPASALLLASGIVGIAGMFRRKQVSGPLPGRKS